MMAEVQGQVTKEGFRQDCRTALPVEIYTLKDGAIEATSLPTAASFNPLKVPDKQRQSRPTSCSDSTRSTNTSWRTKHSSALSSGATETASPAASFSSMARPIPGSDRIDGPNTLHGGPNGFDKVAVEGQTDSAWRRTHLRQPRRRDGISRHADRGSALHTGRQGPEDRLLRHHRQGYRPEPDQPLLFQLGGAGERRHSEGRSEDQCQPLHAGGCQSHSDR